MEQRRSSLLISSCLCLTLLAITVAGQLSTPAPTVFQNTIAPISPDDPRAKAFAEASDLLKSMINISADPCNDFYSFTCGSFHGAKSFARLTKVNYEVMANKIEDPAYRSSELPKPMKQLFDYYDTCKKAFNDWSAITADAAFVKTKLSDLHTKTGITFPAIDQTTADTQMPDKTRMGKIIGYMDGVLRTPTLISSYVDTNWRDPHSPEGYLLQIDQSSLYFPLSYYVKTWDSIKVKYGERIVEWLNQLKPGLDQNKLKKDVDDMLQLELTIAHELMVDDTTRRTYARSYNVFATKDAQTQFQLIDWPTYFTQLSTYADQDVQNMMRKPLFNFNVLEPAMLNKVAKYIQDGKIKARTLINYFNFRVVGTFSGYLPSASKTEDEFGYRSPLDPVMKLRQKKLTPIVRDTPIAQITFDIREQCAGKTVWDLQYANARVYIDAKYPTPEDRTQIRHKFANLMETVLIGFRSMVDQLSWMSVYSKRGAYGKIDDLVKNVAYPDFIVNDQELTNYYSALTISASDSYTQMDDKIFEFNQYKSFKSLQFNGTQRTDFLQGPGLVNAWYQKMADCVVTEYGNFCPLPNDYHPRCLDGHNTQGENIADNGGIHAAYRAYKNYQNLNGPDPLFDDPLMRQLSHDQLFFMGFAQVWCQEPPSDEAIKRQILIDPHSPSLYRVFGTIQNFPAFRSAFNCPLNSKYAPEKHCDVWVNPIKGSMGIPDTAKADDILNIPKTKQIQPDQVDKFNAYMGAVNFFQESMNISADPCNNFYEYVCGSYKKGLSFRYGDMQNFNTLGSLMESPKYEKFSNPMSAVDKTVAFYKKCKKTRSDFNAYISDGKIIKSIIDDFQRASGLQFSMITSQSHQGSQQLDPSVLGKAVGFLSSEGVHTLLTPLVDTDWKTAKTFTLFIDQNTLYYAKTYYTEVAWPTTIKTYKDDVIALLTDYAKLIKATIDPSKLSEDVDKLLELEVQLARKYSTDDTTRRQYARSWNLETVNKANSDYPFINFDDYFAALASKYPDLATFFKQPDFKFSAMEPEKFKLLSDQFSDQFDPNVVVNYLFYRLLAANREFLPRSASHLTRTIEEEDEMLSGFGRRPRKFGRKFELRTAARYKDVQTQCAYEAVYAMQYSTGRIFVDYLYPDRAAVKRINESANAIMHNILKSFQGMLDRLKWMDEKSKKVAYEKITEIAVNVVFPPFIADNIKLNDYYETLTIDPASDYIDMKKALNLFNFIETYKVIVDNTAVDRHQFFLPPAVINAWYQPEMNSITFPAAILRQPFYDENWPASLNYGGFGLVSGHELTHGFDDQGVQWNGIGQLEDWLTPESARGFKAMADCVIKEYDGFCPLKGTGKEPECVNGEQTQGENIADNGGIHAAWRGYKDHVALNGPDPQLPDPLLSKLTHDQLFFMSFGAVWCEIPRDTEALYKQIMTDPHSPSKYRVWGTIENFPAFREAFNCPVGTKYTPAKHCSVWVPKPAPLL
ncbi:unnamed protein product [Anisakis simplex]|uniref:Neprilysin-2 n=1 Tax=Anisakis simplex TaxID=6269 RepID=A0A0M3JXL8_ANISI|nr:unnamed protein product [Anisakis simplex]